MIPSLSLHSLINPYWPRDVPTPPASRVGHRSRRHDRFSKFCRIASCTRCSTLSFLFGGSDPWWGSAKATLQKKDPAVAWWLDGVSPKLLTK